MERNLISKMVKAGSDAAKSFLGFGAFDEVNVGGTGMTVSDVLSPSTYSGQDTPFGNSGWLFDIAPGVDVHFNYAGLSSVIEAYERCAPVFSIINKQSYAFTNGKTWITNTRGKEAGSDYAKKLRSLLQKPNALQNGKQFEAQAAIYLRLFGYCVILPIKPFGFPNEQATSMWIIPPYMCEFTFAKQTFYNLKKGFITSIKVRYGNEVTFLNPEDVIVLRDITPGFDSLFLPSSPIKPLQQNISNLIGIYDSKGMLINYRGALGVLSPEIDPNGEIAAEPGEKEDLQKDLLRLGLRRGQQKFIISPAAVKWQQMGFPYRDLMLTEWAEDDTMVICDGLNYPFKLLANTKSSSMNGTEVEAFKKILYQDFVIPFAEMIYEQLSEAFHAAENNCNIEKDYSHVAVLQDDDQKKALSRKTRNDALLIEFNNNLITLNRWLELNGEDTLAATAEGDFGNMYYYQLVALGWKFGSSGALPPQAQQGDASTQNNNNGGQTN